MKLSERMKEIFDSTQDLTVWVASWIDEITQLEVANRRMGFALQRVFPRSDDKEELSVASNDGPEKESCQ